MGQAGVPTPRPDSSGSVCEPSQRLSNRPLGMGLAVRKSLSKADGFGGHQRCRSRSSTRRASARRWRSWWYRAATVAIPTSTTYSSTAALAVKSATAQRAWEGVGTGRSSNARRAPRARLRVPRQLHSSSSPSEAGRLAHSSSQTPVPHGNRSGSVRCGTSRPRGLPGELGEPVPILDHLGVPTVGPEHDIGCGNERVGG